MNGQLFTPGNIGNLRLRNRSIRAAAFEGMCPGNNVSDDLIRYHTEVAAGGIGMTTVAYASVSRSGLSFHHQLLLRESAIPDLKALTGSVHREGAAAAIQIGHCGLMADTSVSGRCMAPSSRLNLFGPTWPKKMSENDIARTVVDFGNAAKIAIRAGFDALEVHAGHGYLISQFLSPYTNKRTDQWGGSFQNRTRFLLHVIREVKKQTGNRTALIVKMNMRDGFNGGMELDESMKVAAMLEHEGVDALVLSGGFVSRMPMYVMRGAMPFDIMSRGVKNPLMRLGIRMFGHFLVRSLPFEETYFLNDARQMRQAIRTIPLIYVGGLKTYAAIESIFQEGFDFVQLARVLIHDPAFVNNIRTGKITASGCQSSNYCIGRMYSGQMKCFQHESELPPAWQELLKKNSV